MNNIIPFGKPIIGNEEFNSIKKVLDSGILVHGEVTKEFEEKFAKRVGSEFAISVSVVQPAYILLYFVKGLKRAIKLQFQQ